MSMRSAPFATPARCGTARLWSRRERNQDPAASRNHRVFSCKRPRHSLERKGPGDRGTIYFNTTARGASEGSLGGPIALVLDHSR